ncbi:hypothetical protein [Pararhizobium haloflavum]|uniref:hypothetical protein n=1 Tax=Pararhizobium haloflavum TaxID=2037914 RepID=UPI000C1A4BDD|nr:hypothetical protein [Pararhizobium haloflavum]
MKTAEDRITSAHCFQRGARVAPLNAEVADTLARRKFFKRGVGTCVREDAFIPATGTVVGRAGDYAMVHWDSKPSGWDEAVHPANIKAI